MTHILRQNLRPATRVAGLKTEFSQPGSMDAMMQRLNDWFSVLSSRHGSLDAKVYSEPGSRDTQETVVSQSLAGAMRCERLGHHAETQAVGLFAVKQAINHYLHLVWLRTNENQTEGPCTSGPWPAVACIAGASRARQRKEPIRP